MNFLDKISKKPEEEDTLYSLLGKKIAVMPSKANGDGLMPLIPLSEIHSFEVLLKRIRENHTLEYDGVEFICGPLNNNIYFVDVDLHLDIHENSEKLNLALRFLTEDRINKWQDLPYYRVGTKGLAFPIKVSNEDKIIQSIKCEMFELKTSGFCAIPPGIHRKSQRPYLSKGKTKSLVKHLTSNEIVIFNTENLISFRKTLASKEKVQVSSERQSRETNKNIEGRNNYIYNKLVSYKRSLRVKPDITNVHLFIQGILDTIDYDDHEAGEFSVGHWYSRFQSIHVEDIDQKEEDMGILIPLKKRQNQIIEIEKTSENQIIRNKRFSPLLQAYSEKDHMLMHAFPDGLNFKSDQEAIACFELLIENLTNAKPRVWNGQVHIWNGAFWERLSLDRLEKAFHSLMPSWDASKSIAKMKHPTEHLIRCLITSEKSYDQLVHSITTGKKMYLACTEQKKLIIQEPNSSVFTRFKMDYELTYLETDSFDEYLARFKKECPKLMAFLDYAWNTEETKKMKDFENILKCFQEVVAVVLFGMGPRLHKMILFMGIASSGKSTLIQIISGLLPRSFVCTAPPIIWDGQFARGVMLNKLVNVVTDLDCDTPIPSGTFKQIIEGEPIFVDIKRETPLDYAMITCTHLVASNDPPKTKDRSGGFRRRLLCFHNGRQLEEDDADFAATIIKEEGVGLFNFALGAVNRLLRTNKYTETYMNKKILMSIGDVNDPIFRFLREVCSQRVASLQLCEGAKISIENFSSKYNNHLMKIGAKALRLEEFERQIIDKLTSKEKFFEGLKYDIVNREVIGLEEKTNFIKLS